MVEKTCEFCGESFSRKDPVSKFCSRSCAAKKNNKGRVRTEQSRRKTSESLLSYWRNKPGWKPKERVKKGRVKREKTDKVVSRYVDTSTGYVKLYLGNRRVVDEHRYLMEKFIGRKLQRQEVVHHLDGDRQNNDIDNLRILSLSEHSRMHARNSKFVTMKCANCGISFMREERDVRFKAGRGQVLFFCSKTCSRNRFRRK